MAEACVQSPRPLDNGLLFGDCEVAYVSTSRAKTQKGQRASLTAPVTGSLPVSAALCDDRCHRAAAGGRFRTGLGSLLFKTTDLHQSIYEPNLVTNRVSVLAGRRRTRGAAWHTASTPAAAGVLQAAGAAVGVGGPAGQADARWAGQGHRPRRLPEAPGASCARIWPVLGCLTMCSCQLPAWLLAMGRAWQSQLLTHGVGADHPARGPGADAGRDV